MKEIITMSNKSKYFKSLSGNRLQCTLCNHYCVLNLDEVGKCRVRQNVQGEMISLNWGKPTGFCLDPIEKKPLYHYYPGSSVLSFGCLGCNFTCLNCQNYHLSSEFSNEELFNTEAMVSPAQIVDLTIKNNAIGIAYTYSEPTVFWDYILDIIKAAKQTNPELKHILVTNGYLSTELLEEIIANNYIDAMNIDLKFIDPINQKNVCGSELRPILKNIELIANHSNIHLELTNLIIPGLNDSDLAISTLSDTVFSISAKIPLHFSRFYPIFNMQEVSHTSDNVLLRAKQIAERAGIENVFIGNTSIEGVSDTLCSKCGNKLIIRNDYKVNIQAERTQDGLICAKCKNLLSMRIV